MEKLRVVIKIIGKNINRNNLRINKSIPALNARFSKFLRHTTKADFAISCLISDSKSK